MAQFPTSIISFTDPTSTNFLNNPAHATQHANENDEIVALETKVGITNSADTNSFDYKINHIVINRAYGFYIAGTPAVTNDLSWDPIAPETMTAIKIWAACKTAPTGSSVIMQVYNVTQAHVVATVTIAQSATTGNNASITNAAIAAGDVLRVDVTQADSNSIGANYSIICECTQP